MRRNNNLTFKEWFNLLRGKKALCQCLGFLFYFDSLSAHVNCVPLFVVNWFCSPPPCFPQLCLFPWLPHVYLIPQFSLVLCCIVLFVLLVCLSVLLRCFLVSHVNKGLLVVYLKLSGSAFWVQILHNHDINHIFWNVSGISWSFISQATPRPEPVW